MAWRRVEVEMHSLRPVEPFLHQPIEGYQPCFEIASGGMATLYLARQTARAGFNRFVALKLLHRHLLREPGFVEMFLDEANIASRISHPNVCSVIDYDAQSEQPFMALEYLMGEPLSRFGSAMIRMVEPLPAARAASLVAWMISEICEGLHAAHELRDLDGEELHVVHGDVSPQNLYMTYDGVAKVVDFGLVRAKHCVHKTKTGLVKGKFAYVSPEAVALRPVDRRADVWGLGVVLWELLTLRRLFRRRTEVDTLVAITKAPIPPPSEIRPGIPREIDAVVRRALARNPDARYPTARDLGRDLVGCIHRGAEPVFAHDVSVLMDQLFPGARERKLEILDHASRLCAEGRAAPSSRSSLPARRPSGAMAAAAASTPIIEVSDARTHPSIRIIDDRSDRSGRDGVAATSAPASASASASASSAAQRLNQRWLIGAITAASLCLLALLLVFLADRHTPTAEAAPAPKIGASPVAAGAAVAPGGLPARVEGVAAQAPATCTLEHTTYTLEVVPGEGWLLRPTTAGAR